jgi:hypothetical protein
MTVERDGQPLRRYEVTRTVGTRFMQFYVGVQREGPPSEAGDLSGEHMLPFAYWVSIGRWLPKHFFDADGPEELADGVPLVEGIDHVRDVRPYNQVCMNCHNTFAYSYRIYHPLFVGFPDVTVAATVRPLAEALAPTVGEVPPSPDGFLKINGRLDPDRHLVSLGISCESCHFGGREHAQNGDKVRFVPTSRFLQLKPTAAGREVTNDRANPATVNGICTQCHSGNSKLFPNGSAECNSREGLDFQAGACISKLRCVDCHEPHTAGPPSGGPTNPDHVAQCVRCHDPYRDPVKAAAHGRHKPEAANCLDCHVPRQTLGLDALVRTHRISLPVEGPMVAKGMANACNLCHLDQSLRWTLRELERGWGRRLEPGDDWASLPDLDKPAGRVWLRGEHQGMRLVATQSFARSPLGPSMLPDLVRSLNDVEPINRVFAARAVERVRGRKLDRAAYEVTAPPAVRERQIQRLLKENQ